MRPVPSTPSRARAWSATPPSDIQLGVPVRPGDTIEIRSILHEVYEKTGRTGSMYFVVIRFTMTNQRGEMLAVVDNRFMHR